MKKLIMILILCISLTACTAGSANDVHSAKTTVDNNEEWNALFKDENFNNVTVSRDGLAFSGTETLKRDDAVLFLSGSYHGDEEDYHQFYYDGDTYITLLQRDIGSYYASLISKESIGTFNDFAYKLIMLVLDLNDMFENAKYNEEKDGYELTYELGEMMLDTTVYVEDGYLTKIEMFAEDNNIVTMSFSDYGETQIKETPGVTTVDENGWNEAVVFDGTVPFNLYENSCFQGEEYIYNLQCRPYAIALEQFDSGYLGELYVYYGVEDGVTNGEMSIYDYTNDSYYSGTEEAQVDVPSLMNTLIDNFTLNYRFANATYNQESHTYTFDVSRYGEDAKITLVFLDGRLLTMRNDKASGDWIESHYSYDHLEEITPPGVG